MMNVSKEFGQVEMILIEMVTSFGLPLIGRWFTQTGIALASQRIPDLIASSLEQIGTGVTELGGGMKVTARIDSNLFVRKSCSKSFIANSKQLAIKETIF